MGTNALLTRTVTLTVGPTDRLLEIGCGSGATAARVAERLTTGHLLAIDRAAGAVRLARQRNAAHIRAGRAEVRQLDITAADLADGSFDTVFAVNVSLFWMGTPPGLLDRIGRLLVPGGVFHIFAERPTRVAVEAITTRTASTLREARFSHVTTALTGARTTVTGRRPRSWTPA
ncbi:SAM-dependent methyltransferase [Actinoplanes lutulentus]|uniref:Methyltransferase family protein n=1 Tax=Actinoplanes lutulentus TaxID=1287878 RepID=A0A327YWQ7_9ACTN|nr:class I SAM-dependent methyltransferase [Actinoplanes lutulentus]MBB2946447.1 SAM-dependent methyltransferase [Actinoplanes lutulentus]RAK25423.1 methyltransferase family protein [Actinoplanes lutulentus]